MIDYKQTPGGGGREEWEGEERRGKERKGPKVNKRKEGKYKTRWEQDENRGQWWQESS